MKMRLTFVEAVVAFVAISVAPAFAQPISEKGQVSIGFHEIAMKAGMLYQIKVEGKDFDPRLTMQPGLLPYTPQTAANANVIQATYVPSKDETNTLCIIPTIFANTFGRKAKGVFDYSLEVTAHKLAAKPLLEFKGELTANDPAFKADFGNRPHHKSHEIKLNAGQIYIIDMTSPAGFPRLDSYLYLLDSNGKILRSDDDGGGFPNARIIFQTPQDGTYRIISTGLGQALGAFTLTVRTTEN